MNELRTVIEGVGGRPDIIIEGGDSPEEHMHLVEQAVDELNRDTDLDEE